MGRGVVSGVVSGLIVILLIGWVPLAGGLLAGYVGGMHSKNKREALILGFAIGAIGAAAITFTFYLLPFHVFVASEGPLSGWVGQGFTYYYSMSPLATIAAMVVLSIVGGEIGGCDLPNY